MRTRIDESGVVLFAVQITMPGKRVKRQTCGAAKIVNAPLGEGN